MIDLHSMARPEIAGNPSWQEKGVIQLQLNAFNDFTVCDFAYLIRFDVNIVPIETYCDIFFH